MKSHIARYMINVLQSRKNIRELLRKCEPIVYRECLGTKGTKEMWELLESVRKEIV